MQRAALNYACTCILLAGRTLRSNDNAYKTVIRLRLRKVYVETL